MTGMNHWNSVLENKVVNKRFKSIGISLLINAVECAFRHKDKNICKITLIESVFSLNSKVLSR